jgi:gas vesicle protein
MKRLATALAVTGLLALGACNRTPAENNAANVRDTAENKAEAIDNQADAARDAGENRAEVIENTADAVRDAGENRADAIEANDSGR